MKVLFEKLEFISDHMVYSDAPMLGFVKSDSRLFAFRCFTLVRDRLWHWILVPVSSMDVSPRSVIDDAIEHPPPLWVSIVEDYRTDVRKAYDATMTGGVPLLP